MLRNAMSTETQQTEDPYWEVSIEAWGPDDPPGESEWRHYVVQASDESTAKDRAIDKATGVGFERIVGIGDDYRVYEISGPYDPDR